MPATWTPPHTWVTGEIPGAGTFNTEMRDNALFLLQGMQYVDKLYRNSADYTITSTSFGDVDATNLKVGVTSAFVSGRLWVTAEFWAAVTYTDGNATPPYAAYFDIMLDNTTYLSGGSSFGVRTSQLSTGNKVPSQGATGLAQLIKITGWFAGLTTGAAHDIRLRARVNKATANCVIYSNSEVGAYMAAWER